MAEERLRAPPRLSQSHLVLVMADVPRELECPISMELLVDPVSVPCCGRTFSRAPLHTWIGGNPRCPMCNGDLSHCNVSELPKNVVIAYMVEDFTKKSAPIASSSASPSTVFSSAVSEPLERSWSVSLNKLTGYGRTVIGCLDILPKDPKGSASGAYSSSSALPSTSSNLSQFKTLIIPVVDESGSMSGNPTTQVRYSLHRIVDLVFDTPHLLAHVVCYSDRAHSFKIDKSRPKADSEAAVNIVGCGGGTSFKSAFSEIIRVCKGYGADSSITSISILFLTDGEDSMVQKSGRPALVEQFRQDLRAECGLPSESVPLTLHSIGFARDHDFDFLNALRMIGSREGAYRYADPNEDRDSLANKIGSLFSAIASAPAVPVRLVSLNPASKILHSDGNRLWLDMTNTVHTIAPEVTFSLKDETFTLRADFAEEENDTTIADAWYSHLTDQLSGELLQLNKPHEKAAELEYRLHCELVLRRANALLARNSASSPSRERLLRIIDTAKAIQAGEAADARKLNDMRFEGKYGGASSYSASGASSSNAPAIASSYIAAPAQHVTVPNAWPTFNASNMPRMRTPATAHQAFRALGSSKSASLATTLDTTDVTALVSDEGLTLLQAASRCGRLKAVRHILSKKPSHKYLARKHAKSGLNAIDMAALRGYWLSVEALLEAGALPSLDGYLLLRSCLSSRFFNTAKILKRVLELDIDKDMVARAPTGEIATWLSNNSTMRVSFETAINQGMDEEVENKIAAVEAGKADEVDLAFVFSFANHLSILEKPSDSHLRIIEILVKHKRAQPDETFDLVVGEGEDPEVSWPLFIAAQNGNMELLNAILAMDSSEAHINRQNKKGTTALWIAACNRHIDVVYKLLSLKADPNIANFKGDGPLIPCCQKGSINIVELLLDSGAQMDVFNRNRDNPVLICCRTGQSKILKLLLERMTPEKRALIMTESAEIDGFDPVHAATELDKIDCIRVLHSFGADIESRSADTNPIIAGATSLHLAAFYGRSAAATALIELGADPLSVTTVGNYTPLHLAVKQGHAPVIRVLLALPSVKSVMNTMLDSEGHLAAYYAKSESNAAIYAEFFENRLALILHHILLAQDQSTLSSASIAASPASSSSAIVSLASSSSSSHAPASLEQRTLQLITEHAQSIGAYSYSDFLSDASMANDSPLLTSALLTGRHDLARGLIALGAETRRPDSYGITPEFWAHFLGFVPSQAHVPAYVQLMLDRVLTASKLSLQNKNLLSAPRLGATHKLIASGGDSSSSSSSSSQTFDIILKMRDGFNAKVRERVVEELRQYAKRSAVGEESLIGFADKLKSSRKLFPEGEDTLDAIIWEAKIHLIRSVASASSERLDPVNILALFLYTSHPDIFTQVNLTLSNWQSSNQQSSGAKGVSKSDQQTSAMWKNYVQCLYRSLTMLPPHVGEIYRAVNGPFIPNEYTVGTIVSWNSFAIASREWNNLTSWINESPKSDPKTKRGIIFIIQSKTAKRIDKFSRFPVESEVVILPGTSFAVKNIFVASIIAFGQANIRTSTYLAKENDITKAASGETSIIVELEEIEPNTSAAPASASSSNSSSSVQVDEIQ